uniref:Putative secreted protein n=1 Tax=Anopheles marajoara TaxID=58244 RepID=A0A2M4C9B1_9DIPT
MWMLLMLMLLLLVVVHFAKMVRVTRQPRVSEYWFRCDSNHPANGLTSTGPVSAHWMNSYRNSNDLVSVFLVPSDPDRALPPHTLGNDDNRGKTWWMVGDH